MSGTGQNDLQKSIYQKLTGDSTLMGMVQSINDHLPDNSGYPYIIIGDAVIRDWSTTTTSGASYALSIRVFSREAGRKEVAAIMERLYALLHRGTLTVPGYAAVLIRFEASEIRLEDDGVTYQGIMRFRVLLQSS